MKIGIKNEAKDTHTFFGAGLPAKRKALAVDCGCHFVLCDVSAHVLLPVERRERFPVRQLER